MAIDEDYHSTFEKVDTYEGENQPIQIWAKDKDSYEGIGSDKLGIWGTVVGVDFDLCVADGACIDACPVAVYEFFDLPGNAGSTKKPLQINEPDCIFCLACEGVCPPQAIKIYPQ